jgi:hypothetical protein
MAELLRDSLATVHNLAKAGKLTAIIVGKQ